MNVNEAAKEYCKKNRLILSDKEAHWGQGDNQPDKRFVNAFLAGHNWTLEQASEGFEEWMEKHVERHSVVYLNLRHDQFKAVAQEKMNTWQAAALAAEKRHQELLEDDEALRHRMNSIGYRELALEKKRNEILGKALKEIKNNITYAPTMRVEAGNALKEAGEVK